MVETVWQSLFLLGQSMHGGVMGSQCWLTTGQAESSCSGELLCETWGHCKMCPLHQAFHHTRVLISHHFLAFHCQGQQLKLTYHCARNFAKMWNIFFSVFPKEFQISCSWDVGMIFFWAQFSLEIERDYAEFNEESHLLREGINLKKLRPS